MSSILRLRFDKLGNLFATANTRRILLRRGTADEWATHNPILHMGEPGVETDTSRFRIGDGVTPWNGLASFALTRDGGVTEA